MDSERYFDADGYTYSEGDTILRPAQSDTLPSDTIIPPHQGSGAGIAIKGDAWVSG